MARTKLTRPWSNTKSKRSTRNEDAEDKEGVFGLLYQRHPQLAERETRKLISLHGDDGVPRGEYIFAEAFCMRGTCDCRRVMFMVYRQDPGRPEDRPRHVLTIGYGWEPLDFYVKWMHGDRQGAEIMKGPSIELNSPICEYGNALLDLFATTCLSSPEYADRVRRHYELFKGLSRQTEISAREI